MPMEFEDLIHADNFEQSNKKLFLSVLLMNSWVDCLIYYQQVTKLKAPSKVLLSRILFLLPLPDMHGLLNFAEMPFFIFVNLVMM